MKNKNKILSLFVAMVMIGSMAETIFTPSSNVVKAETSVEMARQMEYLDRGLVAINVSNGVFLSWRLLGTEPTSTTKFNIYKNSELLTQEPIDLTNYTDNTGFQWDDYQVSAIIDGVEQDKCAITSVLVNSYLNINLNKPPVQTVDITGATYSYSVGDCSVGDVDGDGQYEIILKWDPSNSKDNSQGGFTGEVLLDCYKLDGTQLWRINLGRNIRAGAHYTQFMVYDLDGDGKAEVACKTADGTKDGKGNYIGDPNADWRNIGGYILTGPEYLTVFSGPTGEVLDTVDYDPPRGKVSDWGDTYGNRVDRFLACVAYLNGKTPSLVMCRGYYTRAVIASYDFKDGKLQKIWKFDSDDEGNSGYRGRGNHSVGACDADGDGFDEIIYGAALIDHDGKGVYTGPDGVGHGDAIHTSSFIPNRAGYQTFSVHEGGPISMDLRDTGTGEMIWSLGNPNNNDNGRGVCGDIDPTNVGTEYWSTEADVYNSEGSALYSRSNLSLQATVYWDGDLSTELTNKNYIDKFNTTTKSAERLMTFNGTKSINGTKATPALQADILGDWREEMIYPTTDDKCIRIYTTTSASDYKFTTLMHDKLYRLDIAWQNVAYNQPPHTSYYLGSDMDVNNVPTQPIYYANIPEKQPEPKPTSKRDMIIPMQNFTDVQSPWGFSQNNNITTTIDTVDAPYNQILNFEFNSSKGEYVQKMFDNVIENDGKLTFGFDWKSSSLIAEGKGEVRFLDSDGNIVLALVYRQGRIFSYYTGNSPLQDIGSVLGSADAWYHIGIEFDMVSKLANLSVFNNNSAQSLNNISYANATTKGDIQKVVVATNLSKDVQYTFKTSLDNFLVYKTLPTQDAVKEYKATINVRDGEQNIAGASININGQTIMTDANGLASIMLKNGSYSYRIVKETFETSTGTVDISDSDFNITEQLSKGSDKNVTIRYINQDGIQISDDVFAKAVTVNSAYRVESKYTNDIAYDGVVYEFDPINTISTRYVIGNDTIMVLTYRERKIPIPNLDTPLYEARLGDNATDNWTTNNALVENGLADTFEYTVFSDINRNTVQFNNIPNLPQEFTLEYDIMYKDIGTGGNVLGMALSNVDASGKITTGSGVTLRKNGKGVWSTVGYVNNDTSFGFTGTYTNSSFENKWVHVVINSKGTNGLDVIFADKSTGNVLSTGKVEITRGVGSDLPVNMIMLQSFEVGGPASVGIANVKIYQAIPSILTVNCNSDDVKIPVPMLGQSTVDFGAVSLDHIADATDLTFPIATPQICQYKLTTLSGKEIADESISIDEKGLVTITNKAMKGIYNVVITADGKIFTKKLTLCDIIPTYSQNYDGIMDFAGGNGRTFREQASQVSTENIGGKYGNVAKFYTEVANGVRAAYKDFGAISNNVVKFEYDFNLTKSVKGNCDFTIIDSTQKLVAGFRVASDGTGLSYFVGDGTVIDYKTYNDGYGEITSFAQNLSMLNKWYHATITIDLDTKKANINIKDESGSFDKTISDIALWNDVSTVQHMCVKFSGSKPTMSMYLDNLNVYSNKISDNIPTQTNLVATLYDNNINILCDIVNNTDNTITPNVIVAIYDKDGVLKDTKIYPYTAVNSTGYNSFVLDHTMPTNTELTDKVKVMLWNGLGNISPITQLVEAN